MVRIDKESVEKMAVQMPPTNESNPQKVPYLVRVLLPELHLVV